MVRELSVKKYGICITGCGSSGTRWVTKVLKRGDIQIGHEVMYNEHVGVASWLTAVENPKRYFSRFYKSSIEVPYRGVSWNRFKEVFKRYTILHQVRHPLKVISTFQVASDKAWEFIEKHVPEITMEMPLIERCMWYWLRWNLMVEERAEWTYQVEKLTTDENTFKEFFTRIGRKDLIKYRPSLLRGSKVENTRVGKYVPLRWCNLEECNADLTEEIRNLGRRYGYPI